MSPGWTPVFYCGESVPDDTTDELVSLGAHVRKMNAPEDLAATLWRFRVFNDFSECQIFLSRDADSIISEGELELIEEWIRSGRDLHIIRAHPDHFWEMPAGLVGFRRGAQLEKALTMALSNGSRAYYGIDADLLREHIWVNKAFSRLVHNRYHPRYWRDVRFGSRLDFPGQVGFDNSGEISIASPSGVSAGLGIIEGMNGLFSQTRLRFWNRCRLLLKGSSV